MECKLIQEYEVSSWERVEFQADEELKEIEKKMAADPDNAVLWMEKGLKLAESALYREAGECYAHAISLDPFNGILYRHRAHRFLSQWRFEDARADFVIASRLIPENWDVWYHLGLSNFLLGDYAKAEVAYQRCLELSKAEDELIAVCDWYYMTELRLGNREKAQALLENIKEDFNPGDNVAYFRRLLMYKGILKPEEVIPADISKMEALDVVTMGFGIANYYWYNGDQEKSNQMIDMILDMGDKNECYFAFGYLAAKVDKKNRG
ncbi:tetratricopeptide repeat protein [Ruminococcus sp. 5_1_39BFAA]|uniref:tetratricopeptide repeat protein n=1 Tax=Ruminococcus sp. 5_1_39BFAA TaxID=457412 RepID=UPI0035645160